MKLKGISLLVGFSLFLNLFLTPAFADQRIDPTDTASVRDLTHAYLEGRREVFESQPASYLPNDLVEFFKAHKVNGNPDVLATIIWSLGKLSGKFLRDSLLNLTSQSSFADRFLELGLARIFHEQFEEPLVDLKRPAEIVQLLRGALTHSNLEVALAARQAVAELVDISVGIALETGAIGSASIEDDAHIIEAVERITQFAFDVDPESRAYAVNALLHIVQTPPQGTVTNLRREEVASREAALALTTLALHENRAKTALACAGMLLENSLGVVTTTPIVETSPKL